MHAWSRRVGMRAAAVALVVVATLLATAGAVSAHVSVQPSSVPGGGFAILSFSVPNEKDDANTVQLEVQFPTDTPISSVSVKPMTGWAIDVHKDTLPKPVKSGGRTVTEAVSSITWTATAGGLEPGQFDLFTVSAGRLPSKGKLEFKALQTYSDGEVVRWIQPAVKGAAEPEFPAPTLTLTKGSGGH